MHKIELKDIRNFVLLAQFGSLTRAANQTGVPKATLSHNLRRLEDELKVELFLRGPKGLTLTDAGRAYLLETEAIFTACEAAIGAAQHAHSNITGMVRLAASAEFGTSIIGAATTIMSKEHPNLDFNIRMFSRGVEAAETKDYDCMIYVGDLPDSDLMQRKLGTFKFGLYASPEYLNEHGVPESLDGISQMPGVLYSRQGIPEQWALSNQYKSKKFANFSAKFRVHDYWMAKYLAISGVALTYLPDFFIHYEVEEQALLPVLPDWQSEPIDISILFSASRHKNPRVKMVVDTLVKNFSKIAFHRGYVLTKHD